MKSVPFTVKLSWPHEDPIPGTHFWASQVLSGLRANGVQVALEDVEQSPGFAVRAVVEAAGARHTVAFDTHDLPAVTPSLAESSLVYFKAQHAVEGYEQPNVVPSGYYLANASAYRYLPLLRAIRRLRWFRYDVYGRFGLRYGGAEIRTQAFEILSGRRDFAFEGSLFRYAGGPDKVPYRKYLFEIPHAKVCVAMPGAGELTYRLVDYLAVGACVVTPPLPVRLPADLVDGEHLVYCVPDLSDLGDVCAQLVRDDGERERIARNAREYFDRHLRREALGAYYRRTIEAAVERELAPPIRRRRRTARRVVGALAAALLILIVLVDIAVVVPEKLGDWPYNPVGRNTRHQH